MKSGVITELSRNCFGCGACQQVCPKRAIYMCQDSEGFLFPHINSDLCEDCDICSRVCPAVFDNRKLTLSLPQRVYAARNKDKTMWMQCTSGAAFPIFGKAILAQGGVVYGCAWNGDGLEASHVRIDNERDLSRLYHSKYVQSSTLETFQSVKSDLSQKLPVLYTGTPCQISGLRLFLQKEHTKLLTIDLLCHGVPSPKMFSAYVAWLTRSEGGTISDLKFRDKKKSGYRAYVSYLCSDGKRRYRLAGLQPYLYGFYRKFFNREACYACPFKQFQRAGDITLADYWGLERHHPDLAKWNRYGASLCMFNTQKGLRWESKFIECAEFAESTVEYAAQKNPALNTPINSIFRPELRDSIYQDLNKYGYDWVRSSYLRPRYKFLHCILPARVKNLLRCFRKK